MPRMAVSGVRISWLMFWRNARWSRAIRSASARASASARRAISPCAAAAAATSEATSSSVHARAWVSIAHSDPTTSPDGDRTGTPR